MKAKEISRVQAFLIHLVISLLIFGVLLYLLFFIWYPGVLFLVDHGWKGLATIAFVDLGMGPVLTLMVYKPGKPKLKLDLTVIALLQAAALYGGIWVVQTERPIALIYTEGQLFSLNRSSYVVAEVDTKSFEPGIFTKTSVFYVKEEEIEFSELVRLRLMSNFGGTPMAMQTDYYAPFEEHFQAALKLGLSYDQVLEKHSEDRVTILAWIDRHDGERNHYVLIPIHSRFESFYLSLTKKGGGFGPLLKVVSPRERIEIPEKEAESSVVAGQEGKGEDREKDTGEEGDPGQKGDLPSGEEEADKP